MSIIRADARHIPLADKSVQCVVTSPPYWGLRDYQVGGQIGLESTPEAYVTTMVRMFREVWRCLKDDGTVWCNLGDAYAHSNPSGPQGALGQRANRRFTANGAGQGLGGLKPKDLIGMPWRLAFALQADGWYLRSDIIWAKPNPIPESVTDRPTRSHEYIFLLTKQERYFYDANAIREPHAGPLHNPGNNGKRFDPVGSSDGHHWNAERMDKVWGNEAGRNKRDVWTVNSEAFPDAHYATFPQKLIEPCILAGSRVGDCVLDPFIGSGTVGQVCERFGRRWVGLELSADYINIAKRRSAQMGLRL